LPTT
jgi:hypothetical protein